MLAVSGDARQPQAQSYTASREMLLLEAALDKARRAHKPLIISRNPSTDAERPAVSDKPKQTNAAAVQAV